MRGLDARRVPEQVIGELAPGQLLDEVFGLGRLALLLHGAPAGVPHRAGRDLAIGQVLGQARSRAQRRKVTVMLVAADAVLEEGVQAVARRRLADPGMARHDLGAAVHCGAEAPVLEPVRTGPARGRPQIAGLGQRRRHLAAAHGAPEGRIDLVPAAALGLDRARLEEQRSVDALDRDTAGPQPFLDGPVALDRAAVVEPRPDDAARSRLGGQPVQNICRIAIAQDQPAAAPLERSAEIGEALAEAPFRGGAVGLEDRVHDEERDDRSAARQRRRPAGVIGQPKVPPQPKQRRLPVVVFVRHGPPGCLAPGMRAAFDAAGRRITVASPAVLLQPIWKPGVNI